MKRRIILIAALSAVLPTGCGVGSTDPVPAGAAASGLQAASGAHYARLYFVGPYGIQAVSRERDAPVTPQQALDLLRKGPDKAERARGLITEVPPVQGRLAARATDGAVDVYLPVPVANMTGRGLGLSQIICTAANAEVPGAKEASAVDVRVHETGYTTAWTVRCDTAGTVVPLPSR
ncbi:hypothetical protein [Streptomyces sp. NPDC006285]|uniref:hypothetical protein n=1 Tax=Streptomyces sp. NPDC006285 TaxID=3364742 RepID=UPI0036780464